MIVSEGGETSEYVKRYNAGRVIPIGDSGLLADAITELLSNENLRQEIARVLGFTPSVSVEDGVKEIAEVLQSGQYRDFDHPIYYNMRWMKLLVEVEEGLKMTGKVL